MLNKLSIRSKETPEVSWGDIFECVNKIKTVLFQSMEWIYSTNISEEEYEKICYYVLSFYDEYPSYDYNIDNINSLIVLTGRGIMWWYIIKFIHPWEYDSRSMTATKKELGITQ